MISKKIIINISKNGIGNDPKFNLKIFGNGEIEYNGIENVKIKGFIKSYISNEKTILLLKKFKEENFFTLNNSYPQNNFINNSSTTISISIPKENSEIIKKSVKYFNSYNEIPKNLLNLEKKIYEIVGLKKWVEYKEKNKLIKEKKPVFKRKLYPKIISRDKKKSIFIISIIVIITLIFCIISTGIFNLTFFEDQSSNKKLKITILKTASSIEGFRDYEYKEYFIQGDEIYIYLECIGFKIKNNNSCNLNVDIIVSLEKKIYFKSSYNEHNISDYLKLIFKTDKDWPAGEKYEVKINIKDNILREDIEFITYFTLLEEMPLYPKIIVLEPASEIRGFKDYDSNFLFDRNDTIYIYEEYSNITIINNSTCDLFLEVTVTKNDIVIYKDDCNKTEVLNNAHKWFFTSNVSWSSGLYYVKAYLLDKVNNKNTTGITFFTLF